LTELLLRLRLGAIRASASAVARSANWRSVCPKLCLSNWRLRLTTLQLANSMKDSTGKKLLLSLRDEFLQHEAEHARSSKQ
jgi:hypothetical protein